jgi:hypothetical protein
MRRHAWRAAGSHGGRDRSGSARAQRSLDSTAPMARSWPRAGGRTERRARASSRPGRYRRRVAERIIDVEVDEAAQVGLQAATEQVVRVARLRDAAHVSPRP